VEARDSAYCFNHQELPSEETCDDCKERFCKTCIVKLRGKTLCGPCKNHRLARLNRPAVQSGMAIAALVLGLMSAPVVFCVSLMMIGAREENPVLGVAIGSFGLLLPLASLGLGLLALRDVEGKPRVAGRALAMIGACCGVVGILWSVTLVLISAGRNWAD
jgi:hypothetical protein